jgi:hypothetical protein
MLVDRAREILLVILVVSVTLRIAVAFYLGDIVDAPPLLTDQRSYHALGARLIAGYGFSFDRPWYPFTPAETPTAHWSFLYSLYVAAVYAVLGVHPLAVRLLGALLGGVFLPLVVYRWTRRLFPDREEVALVAAGCAAVYAYFVLYAATLMTETFYIVVVVWSLARAADLAEAPSLGRGILLGLSLGISALLRQSILPWVLILFAWLLWVGWRSGRTHRAVGGMVAASLVVMTLILAFTVRNFVVYGDFLLLNSNAGYAMYSAQHPIHGTSFQEFTAAPLPEGLTQLNEAQMDRELMRQGVAFVLDDPGRYVLLSLSRVRDYFEFWPSADTTLLHNLGRAGSFGLFLPFMLYGLWLALKRAGLSATRQAWARLSTTPLSLALLFIVFYSLLHILTWAMPRYRLPVDAAALPLAALALVQLFNMGRRLLCRTAARTI